MFPLGLSWWLSAKESSPRFNPWVRKIPQRREWEPALQYSCLGNPMDRGVHEVAKESDTTYRCSLYTNYDQRFYLEWILNFVKCFFCVF